MVDNWLDAKKEDIGVESGLDLRATFCEPLRLGRESGFVLISAYAGGLGNWEGGDVV